MRGEIRPVWNDMWREVWARLARHAQAPDDLFVELFRELSAGLREPPSVEGLAEALTSPASARRRFRSTKATALAGEQAIVKFLQQAYGVAEDLGGDALANRYFGLVEAFLAKFSLRYDLRRPFTLHPTLSGVFAGMMKDLKAVAHSDADLQPIFHEFEEALRDLTADRSERVIKTCIQKQVNLLEALGQKTPGITENTLGAICNQMTSITVWPHASVKDAMKGLYKFSCDYPGIRHAGTPASKLRPIEMKQRTACWVYPVSLPPTRCRCDLSGMTLTSPRQRNLWLDMPWGQNRAMADNTLHTRAADG